MKSQRRGVFLITASTAAIRPRPGVQAYAASKGAVVTLTKSLALEVASHGVRVVSIAPVATETPMLPAFMGKRTVDEEGRASYVATVPPGDSTSQEDLARTAVFLASDDAAMIDDLRRGRRRPLHLASRSGDWRRRPARGGCGRVG